MPLSPTPPNTPGVTDTSFDVTLSAANTAQTLVTAPVGEKIRSFELVNEGPGDAFIKANGVATITATRVPTNTPYQKDNVAVDSLSFIGATGKKPRVWGVAWSS